MHDTRRFFWLSVLVIIALALSVVQLMPRVIETITGVRILRASSFVVEDRNGSTRIMLTSLGGAPQVTLLDESGTARAELALTPMGHPGLSLMSKDGRTVARISTHTASDQPEISIYDAGGRRRWSVSLDPDGVLTITPDTEPTVEN